MKALIQFTNSFHKLTNNYKQKAPFNLSQDLFQRHLSYELYNILVQFTGFEQKHFNGHSMLIKK